METHAQQRQEKDTGRVEAFSDGVFAVAMTLLALELKVPQLPTPTPAALWSELGHQWPGYFAFVTSFATVLIMWVNHHGIFRLIRRTNCNLLFSNGFLLLVVTAVPFSTALVSSFLRTPAAPAACALYAGIFVVISAAYALVLLSVHRDKAVLEPHALPEIGRRLRNCYMVGTPLYSLATIVAPFSPRASLGICSALWIFWTITSVERGTAFSQ
jgi:uncharacterized membrane protein